ncbi:hypothetical protein Ancab_012578 [Ancistrocladus abbreviatus]
MQRSNKDSDQSDSSKNLSLGMGVLPQHCQSVKDLGFLFQDQESSSTQSTGQSYHEVDSSEDNGPYQKSMVSAQSTASGYNLTQGKPAESLNKVAQSMGNLDYSLPPSQFDHNLSYSCVTVAFPDPYSGFLTSYGPQAMIQPQIKGAMPARVPLPFDLSNEPIYVNAKQYHGILRRRLHRAKLEAQNKFSKARKPYLHESRHLHAMKRARGSGGRFLNTKKLQESKTDSHGGLGSTLLCSGGNIGEGKVDRLGNYKEGGSSTSCSDITSASTSDDMYHQPDFRFSGYPSHIGGTMHGSRGGGNYLR